MLQKYAPIASTGIGVLLCVMAFGCIKLPNEPILPASDIQMSIPIIDRTWTVADMLTKDTTKVRKDASGGYYYTDIRTFNATKIDTIKVTPKASGNQVAMGLLTVPGLPEQATTITAQSMGLPTPINYTGSPLPPFPTQNLSAPGIPLQDTVDFDYLHVTSGTMSLTVTNNLALDVIFTNPVVLRNNKTTAPIDNAEIARFNVGTVAAGQSKTVNASLTGLLVRGMLKTDSIKAQTGPRSTAFAMDSTNGISFNIGTGSIVVDSASAKIPQQNLISATDSTITIDSTAVLEQALFTRGNFSLNIDNQSGLFVGARMKFSNFVKSIAPYDTLTFDTTVAPHTNFSFPVNLANYGVINGTQIASTGTTLRFSLGIRTVNSQGVKLPVTANDFVQSSFNPQNQFVVKSLTGIMNPMTVAVNNGVPLTGLGDASKGFTGTFSFDSVQFVLNVGLSGGFPVQHDISLYSINRKVIPPRLDSLKVPTGIIYPGLSTPGVITLNNATGLPAFLSHAVLADSFYIRGSLLLSPTRVPGRITDTTKVYPSMSMYIPIKLGLADGRYVNVTPISGKFDSAFVADSKRGTIYFSISNRMPVSVAFRMAFLRQDTLHNEDTVLTIPQSGLGDTYTIAGAHVNSAGYADAATSSTFNISLVAPEILSLVGSDSLHVRFSINTSGAVSQAVRIQSVDWIHVRASANMVYTVNKKKN